jgi:L-amino acid N-acyltransferase YncA
MHIRNATSDDAAAVHAIYSPIVSDTVISFETDTPSVQEMAARIRTVQQSLPWLVGVGEQDQVLGYVYASKFRERAAYQWTVEVTAYVHERARGQGVARRLYSALFERLVALGYFQAIATITLPNVASVALHEAMGFKAAGLFQCVGHKMGAWRDVGYWQKALHSGALPATPLVPLPPTP